MHNAQPQLIRPAQLAQPQLIRPTQLAHPHLLHHPQQLLHNAQLAQPQLTAYQEPSTSTVSTGTLADTAGEFFWPR